MGKDASIALAGRLDVALSSRGVCPCCLAFVAVAIDAGDERRIAAEIRQAAPLMWDEGLGEIVRLAVHKAARRGDADAAAAFRELEDRRARSPIFGAVVRRLAEALREEVRRAHAASLN